MGLMTKGRKNKMLVSKNLCLSDEASSKKQTPKFSACILTWKNIESDKAFIFHIVDHKLYG
jgi:hypothetical protein